LFILLCFFKNQSTIILEMCICLNLIYGIFMVSANAFQNKYLNWQDIMNEFFVALTFFWMVLYSGIIKSNQDLFFFGKIEMCLILIFCIINLFIIIASTILNNFKIIIYIYNLINHKYNFYLVKD
jgi:hypothetical protein